MDKGPKESDDNAALIMPGRYDGVEIDLAGSPASGMGVAIRAKNALTDRRGTGSLFTDIAVRQQLLSLFAVLAGFMLQLMGVMFVRAQRIHLDRKKRPQLK